MKAVTIKVKDKYGKEVAYHTVLNQQDVGKLWQVYTSFGLTVELNKSGWVDNFSMLSWVLRMGILYAKVDETICHTWNEIECV